MSWTSPHRWAICCSSSTEAKPGGDVSRVDGDRSGMTGCVLIPCVESGDERRGEREVRSLEPFVGQLELLRRLTLLPVEAVETVGGEWQARRREARLQADNSSIRVDEEQDHRRIERDSSQKDRLERAEGSRRSHQSLESRRPASPRPASMVASSERRERDRKHETPNEGSSASTSQRRERPQDPPPAPSCTSKSANGRRAAGSRRPAQAPQQPWLQEGRRRPLRRRPAATRHGDLQIWR